MVWAEPKEFVVVLQEMIDVTLAQSRILTSVATYQLSDIDCERFLLFWIAAFYV